MSTNSSYSIGVVTYYARFDDYFKPLIENLTRIFPDKEINVIINGHSDRTLQIAYLEKVTRFMRQFPNVRYLTYDIGQSLSKCWNQLVILSPTEKVVILSDDVFVGDFFRDGIDKNIDAHDMCMINRSMAHFIISKQTIRTIGWFEERLPRIGWEDTDYVIRFLEKGLEMPSVKILGSLNISAQNDGRKDFDNDQNRPQMKYAYANEDFFKTKWKTKHYNPDMTAFEHPNSDPYYTFSRGENAETPMFYDLSVLDNNRDIAYGTYTKNHARHLMQRVLFLISDGIIDRLRKVKRFIKKFRAAKPPI